MAHLSIPTSYTCGSCAAVFGENARSCEMSVIKKGAMLDAISAKILSDRGVDVGIRSDVELIPSRPSMVHDERGSYLVNSKCSEGRFMRGELDGGCKVLVSADKDAIHQVLYNLCHNAIKFSNDGGKFKICIKSIDSKHVRISVFDEGQPISK